ncbi:MAG: protein kinase, partial [Candidatus Obscuribacterales bacterium]|nr:protein kinase [Candidatus Obscuribacterales bacterium]
MADDSHKKCATCGGVLAEEKPATFTQWMFLCDCGKRPVETETSLDIPDMCRKCGKRIDNKRSGSITQWVFRSQLCNCDVPEEMLHAIEKGAPAPLFYQEPAEAEVALAIDPNLFPQDRFVPLELLGRGSASQVFRCHDLLLNKMVSVKSIGLQSAEFIVAIQNEARAIGCLKHPGVIEVFDCGVAAGGQPFIVMEYFKGQSLGDLLKEGGEIESSKAITLARQVCSTMNYVHRAGIFHRDLKPANILIRDNDDAYDVKLIDFSIAVQQNRLLDSKDQPSAWAGSPLYMSPDEAEGREFTKQSEIYSFGCVLFEMLLGAVPFYGDTPMATMSMHARQEVPVFSKLRPDLEIDPGLEEIVKTCLAKEPEQRFETFAKLDKALSSISKETKSPEDEVFDVAPGRNNTFNVIIVSIFALLIMASAAAMLFTPGQKTVKKSAPRYDDYLRPVKAKHSEFKEAKKFRRNFLTAEPGITDGDLPRLKDLVGSRESVNLDLSGTRVNGKGLSALSGLPIDWLAISDTSLSQAGFDALAEQKNLKCLTLERVALNDDAIKKLCSMKGLRILDVQATGLQDAQLEKLCKALPNLEDFDVTENRLLTPAGLKQIAGLKNLKTLYMA